MDDLRTLVRDKMTRAGSPSYSFDDLGRRRDRKRRNQRITAGVVGMAVFVAAVWIVTGLAYFDRSETSVGPAGDVTGTQTTNPLPKGDYLLDLNTGEMTPLPEGIRGGGYAASPDGSRLAFAKQSDGGTTQIFIGNLDGTGTQQVTDGFEAADEPAWSPDGSKIAFIGYHDGDLRDLFVLDLATGVSTQLSFSTLEPDPAERDFSPWRSGLPSFTPDGSSIVYTANRDDNIDRGAVEVRMVPVAGGKSVVLMRDVINDGLYAFDKARLSPDGSQISYTCLDQRSFCVANADGTDERVLVQSDGDSLGGGTWSPDGTQFASSAFHQYDVSITDVATGGTTYVAEGWGPTWLDDHTLIVEMPGDYDPQTGQLCHNPPGEPGCHKG
jgi:WD40-like Beta Propeller Repeat